MGEVFDVVIGAARRASEIWRTRRVHIVAERGHGTVDRIRVVLLQRLKQGDDIVVEVVAATSVAGCSIVVMRIRRRVLTSPCRRRRVGDRS